MLEERDAEYRRADPDDESANPLWEHTLAERAGDNNALDRLQPFVGEASFTTTSWSSFMERNTDLSVGERMFRSQITGQVTPMEAPSKYTTQDGQDSAISFVHYMQCHTGAVLPFNLFKRAVIEISRKWFFSLEFEPAALKILRGATESYLIVLFEETLLNTINAESPGFALQAKGVQLAHRIRGEYGPKQ